MGLDVDTKEQIIERYPTCFTYECPEDVHVLATDMMQFVKGQLPGNIVYQYQLVNYFANKMLGLTDKVRNAAFACFDKASPDVKKMVCHGGRYERRCKQCKTSSPSLPSGQTADKSHFHPECDKGCIHNQILWFENGPYLSSDPSAPLPDAIRRDWMKFASDSRNLYYELYPRIANAMIQAARHVPPGKILFVSGLPFNTKVVDEIHPNYLGGDRIAARRSDMFTQRTILDEWSVDAMRAIGADRLKELVSRVYAFEAGGGREVVEMRNEIHEADNVVFYFSHFFPPADAYRHMAYINDGDAISIGLLRALEDVRGGPESVVQEQWLCLPFRSSKKKKLMGGKPPDFQYVNLTKLCQEIERTPSLVEAGVQSPIAAMVFLIILSATDFFQGEFCFGINFLSTWDVFFSNLPTFTHLVQYYPNDKSPTVERRIVLDEDLFKIFTQMCYASKYAEGYKKKRRIKEEEEVDYETLRVHCSATIKDARKHPPTDAVMLRWCRQITWNANYWANAFRNIYIDPFDAYNGQSYYGYVNNKDGEGMRIVDVVSSKQRPVDEVYKRHFWKRKQKEPAPKVVISEKRKMTALELIRGGGGGGK